MQILARDKSQLCDRVRDTCRALHYMSRAGERDQGLSEEELTSSMGCLAPEI